MAEAVFRATVRGARRKGHGLNRAGRRLQRDLIDELGLGLAPRALRTTRAFAPSSSGRLSRGLKATVRSYGGRLRMEIESTARSESGFPYTQATRTGRKAIRPIEKQYLSWVGRDGRRVFTKYVRPYRPARDWMDAAAAAIDREAALSARRIGRAVDTRQL